MNTADLRRGVLRQQRRRLQRLAGMRRSSRKLMMHRPSVDDGSQLKVERLQFDASTGELRPMASGQRFGRVAVHEVHCALHPTHIAGQPGVLQLPAAEQHAIDERIDELRAAAIETIRERRLARERAKQKKEDLSP
mmetsp:Transcript_25635/g.65382  ORF Transcript_25635/g.65382 Transcript_25635/m.65382 type:complete len:136 (-) Transcript_25635:413-820(-)